MIDWPEHEREELASRARRGLVVVARTGCRIEVLGRCNAPPRAAYRFIAYPPENHPVTLKGHQQTHDLIPVYATSYDQALARAGELHAALTVAGNYQMPEGLPSYDELQGECQGATHVITSIDVGAFSLYAEIITPIVPESEAPGGKRIETLNSGGSAKACSGARPGDAAPRGNCDSPLRIELSEIASTSAQCTPGTQRGACERKPVAPSFEVAPEEGNRSRRQAARARFDEGRKLTSRGEYGGACEKYQESYDLDPGDGTLLHLADCHEQAGRTATAWKKFLELASILRATKQTTREKVARERVELLARRLSGVTIKVPQQSRIPGLVIRCDGREVAAVQWGLELPLDPGKHTLEAVAPGMRGLTREVVLDGSGLGIVVIVPVLAPEGETPSLPSAP